MKSKYKDLRKEDIDYIYTVHSNTSLAWDDRMKILMSRFEISERTVRRWIKRLGFSKYEENNGEQFSRALRRSFDKKKKYFIITWAQNATSIHSKFFENIQAYAKHLDASIHIIAGKYRNPNSPMKSSDQDWWAEEIIDYIDAKRQDIHKYVSILSDVKVQPTASNPLSGLESITGERTSIIGHPRVHLKSLPVLEGYTKKFLISTGSLTIPNYTDSKLGKKAEFHHTYGFTIVEIKNDNIFYPRQVTACEDGSFTDVTYQVKDKKVERIDSCSAFIFGDIHVAHLDWDVFLKFKDFLNSCKPGYVILHDLFDGKSINRHTLKDPVERYRLHKSDDDNLEKEINQICYFLDIIKKYKLVVVRSNHDLWLESWVRSANWSSNFKNSELYLKLTLALLQNSETKDGLLAYLLRGRGYEDVDFLNEDSRFSVSDWELGQHFHLGANGSRGSFGQYKKLNIKVIGGHSHQIRREDGALMIGTCSKLRMGYNKGPSAHVNGGGIVHNDGKAQQFIFMDDNFTTLI